MKILKLSAYYEPEQIASSHLTKDLEEAYIENGFLLKVITPTPSRTVSKEVRKKYKKIRYETKYDGKIEIIRFPLFREGNNVLLRAFRYLVCLIKQYRIGRKQKDIDIIISGSTPPIQGLLVAKLKKKLKVPLIYVLQDVFPDSLLNTGIIKRKGLIWKIGRKIEDYTYKNSDKIIVISEDFKQNIISKGVPDDKVVIISNWINTENVKNINRNRNYLFTKYDIDINKFIISYCGNIGFTQDLEMVLQVAKKLETYSDILFVIIGEGKNKNNIIKIKEDLNLKNVSILPFQPQQYISEVFSLGNIGLIVSKPNIGKNSVPSKVYSMMSAKQPILAVFDVESELSNIIKKSKSGICIEPNNPDNFFNEILRLKQNPSLLKEYSKNGHFYVTNIVNKNKQVLKYVLAVKSFIKTT